jgi:hypothetical protein
MMVLAVENEDATKLCWTPYRGSSAATRKCPCETTGARYVYYIYIFYVLYCKLVNKKNHTESHAHTTSPHSPSSSSQIAAAATYSTVRKVSY